MSLHRTYCLLVLLLFSAPAVAEAYKWVDGNGRVHYSDRPRPGGTEAVHIPATLPADPHLAERRRKQQRLLEAIEQERNEKLEAEERSRQQQAGRRRDCIMALDQLRMVDRQGRVFELDDAGKRRYWDPQTRAQRRDEISRFLEENCD